MPAQPTPQIQRLFAALFSLFHVPGSKLPEPDPRDEIIMAFIKASTELNRQNPYPKEASETLFREYMQAMENAPLIDPGATVSECIDLAKAAGLEVRRLRQVDAIINNDLHGRKIVLTIERWKDDTETRIQIRFRVFTGPLHSTLLLSVAYWEPVNCPMIVCQPYLHPRANHDTIAENLRLGLLGLDKRFANYAIANQRDYWDGAG